MPPIEFLADRSDGGKTIATVLRLRFRLPWSQVKRMIERGHVRVAGFVCTDPAHRVKFKNRVWIREGVLDMKRGGTPKPSQPAPNAKGTGAGSRRGPRPEAAVPGLPPDCIVYVDEAIVVANKPPGLTTMRHASEAVEFGPRGRAYLPKTFADLLPLALGEPTKKLTAVHRIDRDTSGLVVFARTQAAADHLTQQFRKHNIERRYLALVRGVAKSTRIASDLVDDRGDGRRGSGPPGTGKRAVTFVKVLQQAARFALVECRLETGRTHQVRIHLGEAGTPLCGETVYDRPRNGSPLPDGSDAPRVMLHAAKLGLVHPISHQFLTWEVAPPPDFLAVQARVIGGLAGHPSPDGSA